MAGGYRFTGEEEGDEERRFKGGRKALLACGATQFCLGIGGAAVGGASFGIKPANYQIAAGIWGGALLFLAGIVSLATSKSTSRKSLECSMAFSIIACVACAPWIWFSSTGAGFDHYENIRTGIFNQDFIILNLLSTVLAILGVFCSVPAAVSAKKVRDENIYKGY